MPQPIESPEARGAYVGDLAAAHQRGLITWESVTRAQDAVMPRCEQCHAEPMVDAGSGRCTRCYTLARCCELVAQMSDLLTQRGHITAEIRRLHAEARPLHQQLLRTMTLAELDAAYDARCRAMTRQG